MKKYLLVLTVILSSVSVLAADSVGRQNAGCNFTNNLCADGMICRIAMGHGDCYVDDYQRNLQACIDKCLTDAKKPAFMCEVFACGQW